MSWHSMNMSLAAKGELETMSTSNMQMKKLNGTRRDYEFHGSSEKKSYSTPLCKSTRARMENLAFRLKRMIDSIVDIIRHRFGQFGFRLKTYLFIYIRPLNRSGDVFGFDISTNSRGDLHLVPYMFFFAFRYSANSCRPLFLLLFIWFFFGNVC